MGGATNRDVLLLATLCIVFVRMYICSFITKGKNLKHGSCCVCKIFSFYSRFVRFFMTLEKHLGIKLRLYNVDMAILVSHFNVCTSTDDFVKKIFELLLLYSAVTVFLFLQ